MPYSNISELPARIKKYPQKIQRMFMKVFNSKYNKVYKETKNKNQAESEAYKLANGVLKKNMEKFGSSRYGHGAYVQFLLDKFLENI
jgi:cation transport regulator ChaB